MSEVLQAHHARTSVATSDVLTSDLMFSEITIKSCTFFIGFRGIRQLGSALIFLR